MNDLDTSLSEQKEISEDIALATLLSKLASLQGEAVSKVQLTMTMVGHEGADIAPLDRIETALEIWKAIFPAGVAELFPQAPVLGEMPSLWISEDQSRAYILTGLLTSGSYQTLDTEGSGGLLSANEAAAGHHLCLLVKVGGANKIQAPLVTAWDWFKYALLKRRHIFIEAAVATGFINLLALGGSLYSMNIYDRVIPTKTYSTLWVLSIGVGIAYLFDFVLRQVRSKFVESACREIDDELSDVFFQKMLSIRMDRRPQTVGTFSSELRQYETVRSFLTSITMFVLADAPFSLLFIAIIALIAGPIAIIPLLLLPITLIVVFLWKNQFFKLSQQKIEQTNQRNGLLVEVISGIESVKASHGGWKFSRRWGDLNRSLSTNELAMKHHSHTLMMLVTMIQQFLYVAIVVAGVYEIHDGLMTTGALIACTIIGSRALAPAAALAGIISQWQGAKAALNILETIMALPSDGLPENERMIIPEVCNGVLEFDSVKFAYGPEIPLSLDVPQLKMSFGERIVVMGSSGSGKSTFLKVASGLYFPTEGKVGLDGIDMANLAPGYLREHIGYLPQDVWLFEGTLRDNIIIGLPSPSDAQILRAAELTGLIGVIQSHPMGLSLPITEGGRGLSVGQRQLVGLTRILIARPKIILLDEPTAAMDGRLEQHVINQLVQNIPKDSLLVLVTHKPELIRYSTRVLIVEKSKIALDGPRDKVVEFLNNQLATQKSAAESDDKNQLPTI
jgi:ATP-binding cassette subfamily C protein LapB